MATCSLCTLDRLGRTVRDALNLILDLAARRIEIINLTDPIKVKSANPDDSMGSWPSRCWPCRSDAAHCGLERTAGARAARQGKGRHIGRPTVVAPDKLAYAAYLRDTGATIAEMATKTASPAPASYRHKPPGPRLS